MSLPANANRTFLGVNVTFQVSGATYQALGNIRLSYGHTLHEEVTVGNAVPYLGTGAGGTTVEFDGIAASDIALDQTARPTGGQLTDYNVRWGNVDTQTTTSGRTWTISGVKFGGRDAVQLEDAGDNFVKIRCRGQSPLIPNVSGISPSG